MGTFTGGEVVQMAMSMEQVGQGFYQALAEGCDNPQVAALCRRLAQQELGHYTYFKRLRDRLIDAHRTAPVPPDKQVQAENLVRSFVVPEPEKVRRVAMGGKLRQAVDLAMHMEQDAIKFYHELLRIVPEEDRGAVRSVIAEEDRHLQELRMIYGAQA